ncbi:hypothetical protein V8D89_012178 [Ganoderma adspersum]
MQEGQPRPPDLTRRLPAEILAMIFHRWKDSCRSKRYGLGADWVRATWICKRWREVALETPSLWSSVLISQGFKDDPAPRTQLDRARGAALELFVSNGDMSIDEVEGVTELILARRSPITKFKIVCCEFLPSIEEFTKAVAADMVSLSVHSDRWERGKNKLQFSSDVFPRLRQLTLCRIMPTPGAAPMLNLTRLDLAHALDRAYTVPPGTGIHQFLATCPNLEALSTFHCFEYEVEDMIEERGKDVLPVVTLPRLRSLSMEELGLDIATAVGTLRLPALSTFDLTGHTACALYHCDFFMIPQNISEALPPLRRSRWLSLVAGGETISDVTFQGGPSDTLEDGDDGDDGDGWSIMLPDLDDEAEDPEPLGLPNPYCIRSVTGCFLARIPHLVVPSDLVRLQLHISNGLPMARDWTLFFAAMPRLRTLGIGSGALIRLILAAFEGDVALCPELEGLELCVGVGLDSLTDTIGEGSAVAEFILRALGTWVRGRPTPLGSLTIQPKYPDNSDSDHSDSDDSDSDVETSSGSSSGSESEPLDEELDDEDDDEVSERNSEPTESWAGKLYEDVQLTLKGFVHEVFLAGTDCPACGAEYEPVEWDAIARGELRDGVTYY